MVMILDDDQAAVAEQPAESRRLVLAGAGQGKTEVVAARLAHLADEEELSLSAEVLVLSFSRAAVHAVRERVEGRGIVQPNVRTFDSFASYLLAENGLEPVGSFAVRIRQATKLLGGQEYCEGIDEIRHLIVDEVQDLVGDRAEMVLALLDRLGEDVGFTALGDPLQGVYDFTLDDSQSKRTSSEVFDALTGRFGAEGMRLRNNYRAQGPFPKDVVQLSDTLRSEVHPGRAAELLLRFQNTLPHAGVVHDWAFLEDGQGRSAILCETNGEVLLVSKALTRAGVRHVVRRQARDFGAAAWVYAVLGNLKGPKVARKDVEDAIAENLDGDLSDEAWYLLRGAEGAGGSMHQLDLPRLRGQIRSGAIPLTLTESDDADVIVSTIHRAKGLEFDRVFLLYRGYEALEQDAWESIRQRYVALSRARNDVSVIDLGADYSWFRTVYGRRRQYKKSKANKPYVKAIEVTSADVTTDRPFSGRLSAAEVQMRLQQLTPGTPLTGFHDPALSGEGEPVFVLQTPDGDDIGATTRELGVELQACFGFWFDDGWDNETLVGASVVAVETAAGETARGEQAGLGTSGLWLVPRISGLVTPKPS